MQNYTMSILYNMVDKPHIENYDRHSGLLLFNFKFHKGDESRSNNHDAMRFMIPAQYIVFYSHAM